MSRSWYPGDWFLTQSERKEKVKINGRGNRRLRNVHELTGGGVRGTKKTIVGLGSQKDHKRASQLGRRGKGRSKHKTNLRRSPRITLS